LRVLHVASGNLFGGIETVLVTLARLRHLCPSMIPSFAVCFSGRLDEELRRTGAPVHVLGAVRVRRPWTIIRARQALRRLLMTNGADVVVCHGAWTQALLGPAAQHAGVPLVFFMHGFGDRDHWLERWARRVLPQLALSNSHAVLRELVESYPNARCEVAYHPVDLSPASLGVSERQTVRRELDTPSDEVVIAQVSRMEPLKGHGLHLEALARLPNVGWRCWMIGGAQRTSEAVYAQQVRQKAADLGLRDRVKFVGLRQDVARLLLAADIYCQPNTSPEGFGLTFVEALAAGLPVVTTAMGGALEIVTDRCGVLCPPEVASLAEALQRLLQDTGLRASLGEAGRTRAKELSDPQARMNDLARLLRTAARPARADSGRSTS
jgi:glycosyltransferase involved in cell wall biosynthesis